MITIAEAIKSINPNAEFVYTEEDINTIEWHNETTPISVSDIQAKQTPRNLKPKTQKKNSEATRRNL